MKVFAKILIMILAILAIAIPLMAQDETRVTVSADAVNVRSGDGTQFSIRGALSGGSLTVTGRNDFDTSRVCTGIVARDMDMWLRVDLNGVEGWVSLCTVKLTSGTVAGLPVVTPSNSILISDLTFDKAPAEKPLGDASVEKFVYGVTRAQVNMRNGASLSSDIVEVLRAGELVYVVATNNQANWVKVEVDGKSGWIARYLMSLPQDWQKKIAS